MSIAFFFAGLGAIVALVLHHLKLKSARRASTYGLYAARDALILLVAEDKLSEENPIFEYYYPRITYLLQKAPAIGIDRAIEALLTLKDDDFDKALATAKENADEMYRLTEKEGDEVSAAVSMYYEASKDMILVHSSFIRLTYVFLVNMPWQNILTRWLAVPRSKTIRAVSTFKAARFADDEAKIFRHMVRN